MSRRRQRHRYRRQPDEAIPPTQPDPTRELPSEDSCEPLGDSDERFEVDAGVDPFAMEQVDKILGGDVPGGARREGAAAEAAH